VNGIYGVSDESVDDESQDRPRNNGAGGYSFGVHSQKLKGELDSAIYSQIGGEPVLIITKI
jgi:hypothetical protein